jgi:hypothetical protein
MWLENDDLEGVIDEERVEAIAVENKADRLKLAEGLQTIADRWIRIRLARRRKSLSSQLKRLRQIELGLKQIIRLSTDAADDDFQAFELLYTIQSQALSRLNFETSFDDWLKDTAKIIEAVNESRLYIRSLKRPNRRAIGEVETRRLVKQLADLYTGVTGERFARTAPRCQRFVADCMEAMNAKPLSPKSVADYYWREVSIRRKK